jgi:hypothetical protein
MALTAMHRFPEVCRLISNIKAYVKEVFHSLSKAHAQSYADFFSWRYSHRGCNDACMELLHGIYLVHVPLSVIAATATLQLKLPKPLAVWQT